MSSVKERRAGRIAGAAAALVLVAFGAPLSGAPAPDPNGNRGNAAAPNAAVAGSLGTSAAYPVSAPLYAESVFGDSALFAAMKDQDMVVTDKGDRLFGKVAGIGADGRLRLTGPAFDGETRVLLSTINRIVLAVRRPEVAAGQILLTNGDRLEGTVTAITPDRIEFQTTAAGPITVARPMVSALLLTKDAGIIAQTRFAEGSAGPWASPRGTWAIADGLAAPAGPQGFYCSFSAKIGTKDAVTLEVRLQPDGSSGVSPATQMQRSGLDLALFAGDDRKDYGNDRLSLMVIPNNVVIRLMDSRRNQMLFSRQMPNVPLGDNTYRFAYDPAAGTTQVWIDAVEVAACDVPWVPAGDLAIFGLRGSTGKIGCVRLHRGVAAPGEYGGPGKAEEQTDSVELVSGDIIAGKSMTLKDGHVLIATEFGELRPAAADIRSITFRKAGRQTVAANPADLWVDTAVGRITLQVETLTGEQLTGKSACLGPVKLARGTIVGIRRIPPPMPKVEAPAPANPSGIPNGGIIRQPAPMPAPMPMPMPPLQAAPAR